MVRSIEKQRKCRHFFFAVLGGIGAVVLIFGCLRRGKLAPPAIEMAQIAFSGGATHVSRKQTAISETPLRVVLAGLFVVVGMGAGIALLSVLLPRTPVWMVSTLSVATFFGLVVAALVLFNAPGGWRRKKVDPEILARKLQAQQPSDRRNFQGDASVSSRRVRG